LKYTPFGSQAWYIENKMELEDLCLRYLDPKGYYDLVNKIAKKRREREAYISEIIKTIQEKTVEIGIDAHIEEDQSIFTVFTEKWCSK